MDFISMIDEFSDSGLLAHCLNNVFISLIPKVEGAFDIVEYRPISLMESVCNIVTKVMAMRRRKVIHETVSYAQGDFIKKR